MIALKRVTSRLLQESVIKNEFIAWTTSRMVYTRPACRFFRQDKLFSASKLGLSQGIYWELLSSVKNNFFLLLIRYNFCNMKWILINM